MGLWPVEINRPRTAATRRGGGLLLRANRMSPFTGPAG